MAYMQDVDRWLEELLQDFVEGKTFDDLKRAIREKILESYRNGGKTGGQSPAPQPPQSRSGKKGTRKAQRFAGPWQCTNCGAAIESLPFKPKDGAEYLLCLACYNAGREGK